MTEPAYAELHAHSGFSFLDGSSDPEELVAEADRLGLAALALTDHHGFYGVVRFAEAARACGLPTVFGTEVTLAPAEPAHRRARPDRGAPRRAGPGPRRLRPALDRAGRRPPRGRGEGEARLHPRRAGPRRGRATGWCSAAAGRGRSPPR